MIIEGFGDHLPKGYFKIHSIFTKVRNFESIGGSCFPLLSIVAKEIRGGPQNIVINGDISSIDKVECNDLEIKLFFSKGNVCEVDLKCLSDLQYNSHCKAVAINKLQIDQLEKMLLCKEDEDSLIFLLREKSIDFAKTINGMIHKRFFEIVHCEQSFSIDSLLRLKGLGIGLTPSGDDFLAGVMLAFDLCKEKQMLEELYTGALGQNQFSNTLFYNIKNGFYHQRLKILLMNIFGCDVVCNEDKMMFLVNLYLEIGSTSGADFLVGLVYGLKKILG